MKTNTLLRIPILEEAKRILKKYKEHPRVSNSDISSSVFQSKNQSILKRDNKSGQDQLST